VSGDPVDLDVTVKKIARDVRQHYGPVMVPLGDMALLSSGMSTWRSARLRTQTSMPTPSSGRRDPADYRVVVVKSAQHLHCLHLADVLARTAGGFLSATPTTSCLSGRFFWQLLSDLS